MKNLCDYLAYIIAYTAIVTVIFMSGYIIGYKQGNGLPPLINGDTVQINYTYNYDRLTAENCVTDWECKTADILHKYETGELQPYTFLGLDYDEKTQSYHYVTPVAEPASE